jgi:hypothetical protein
MDEQLIIEANKLLCWRGPKMGMTVLTAKPGRLVLTDQRLLFLSSKSSTGVPPVDGAPVSRALDDAGSLEIPLASVTRCEPGAKRALVVWHRSADGAEAAHAFGQQMGMPSRDAWVAEINRLRGAALN